MDQLEGEILQYEAQLAQVRLAASELPEGPEKKNLIALEADLKELITLSKNSLAELLNESISKEDTLSEEYNLFKAELEGLDVKNNDNIKDHQPEASQSDITKPTDLKNELDSLKGTKCQAPFMYKWSSDVTYHNAIISQVPEPDGTKGYDDIEVKVMFTNPTHKEMRPCPYYLEGNCKFSNDKCRYSHGELVLLSSLKDYREPVFSKLCPGCKVFAKQDDGLWYRATVISVKDACCDIKFESNSKEEEIPFHNILLLDSNNIDDETSSSDDEVDGSDDSDVDIPVPNNKVSINDNNEELIKRILSNPSGSALGEWEKFTKGFGSRIMAKMGYIHGSGLGKNGTGQIEPVSAVILPVGKSLDHCMMLKEKAGNNKDLFKAERKMKYLQKKHEERLKRMMENKKEKTNVFTFLNTKLDPPKEQNPPKIEVQNQIKNESTRNLNITCLQLAEEARRVEKEIKSLGQSLSRHTPHSHAFNIIKEKLTCKENKLLQLHASERKIRNEQDQRRDRQKLTIF